MKKVVISIFLLFSSLLGSTYFVGEMVQSELNKQVVKLQNQQIKIQLISYQKSFLTAKAQLKLILPLANKVPLQLLIDLDISHYPHKAKATNHITLLNNKRADTLTQFFKSNDWLFSSEEISLVGNITGEIKIMRGSFKNEIESLNTTPLSLTYQYSLSEHSGAFEFNWAGFNGAADEEIFDIKNIAINAAFSKINSTGLFNYQYQAQLEQFEFKRKAQHLMLKNIWLAGKSKIGKKQLTVNTQSNWKVKEFQNGEQIFTGNHIKLLLSDINLAALNELKSSIENPHFIQQQLSNVLILGAKIDLQTIRSDTPWGEVTGKLNMDIQRGAMLADVLHSPLSLIDYSNGELSLSLPQNLQQQADVGSFIKMGVMSGVLKPQQQQLTLQSSLDRGELIVNGQVIPM